MRVVVDKWIEGDEEIWVQAFCLLNEDDKMRAVAEYTGIPNDSRG